MCQEVRAQSTRMHEALLSKTVTASQVAWLVKSLVTSGITLGHSCSKVLEHVITEGGQEWQFTSQGV